MTAGAIHHGGFYVDVSRAEVLAVRFVAFSAKCLEWLVDQCDLARKMRLVALQAVFRSWIVLPLGFHLLLHFFVAAQTQVRTLCQQQRTELRLVRVVATRALTGGHRLMLARRRGQVFLDVVVTFPTDFGLSPS